MLKENLQNLIQISTNEEENEIIEERKGFKPQNPRGNEERGWNERLVILNLADHFKTADSLTEEFPERFRGAIKAV